MSDGFIPSPGWESYPPPMSDWRSDPATSKQLDALARRGVEPLPACTKGQAGDLLRQPTPRMRQLLERHGRWNEFFSFEDARAEIDRLMQTWFGYQPREETT
jgi:hypothetical protein